MSKTRGVRGAAGWCAIAAILYLLARSLLYAGISALVGVVHPGASLVKPIGVSEVGLGLLQIVIAVGAALVPLLWMLRGTRLQTDDLRITVPAPWSPAFCLPVFLGVASTANLCGGLLVRLAGAEDPATLLPSGGAELFVQFLALCAVPAVVEELLFRGALQGLMRPSGSAAAIFGPALLFGLLHLDLAQGLTAFACGVFLGWLAERSGSILPGMLLHFCNNTLAFLNLYLRFYAPQPVSFGVELFILFFFPVFGVWLIWHARQQGFRFSAGLRPGVAKDGEIIARAHNLRESGKNATYHAELMAIDAACKALGGWRLWQCELFVTLEPCPMCSGAIINSRLKRVVYGARDPKAGCCGSLTDLFALPFNHHPVIESGLLEEEAQALLQDFFAMLREKRKKK